MPDPDPFKPRYSYSFQNTGDLGVEIAALLGWDLHPARPVSLRGLRAGDDCPRCRSKLKALLTDPYCPNDCDRPEPAGTGTPTTSAVPAPVATEDTLPLRFPAIGDPCPAPQCRRALRVVTVIDYLGNTWECEGQLSRSRHRHRPVSNAP